MPSLSANLLSHNNGCSNTLDEPIEVWPKMPFIIGASTLPRDRKGLTWATSCNENKLIWPSSKTGGMRPSSNPGEEVVLGEASEGVGVDVFDRYLVNISITNQSFLDEVPEPLGGVGIVLVIIGVSHAQSFPNVPRISSFKMIAM
jgi:hypothetical protein